MGIPLQFVQDVGLDYFIGTGANRHVICLLSILCVFDAFTLLGLLPDNLLTTVIGIDLVASTSSLTVQLSLAMSLSVCPRST